MPIPLLYACHVGMATVVLGSSQRAPTWHQQHCSSGEVAEVGCQQCPALCVLSGKGPAGKGLGGPVPPNNFTTHGHCE